MPWPPCLRFVRLPALVAMAIVWSVAALGRAQPAQINQGQSSGSADARFRGFNMVTDSWLVSGLDTSPGAYLSQLYAVLMPSYDLGGRHLKGTWGERLRLSGRIFAAVEFTGNSVDSRGTRYTGPILYESDGPAGGQRTTGGALPVWSSQPGLERRPVLSDLWLAAFHDRMWTIPGLEADLQGGVRVVLPTSAWSMRAGMLAAPSLYLGLARRVTIGIPIDVSYGVRTTRYFFASGTIPRHASNEPIEINGRAYDDLWAPTSTGELAPEWLVAQTLNVGLPLPADFTLSLSYTLFDQWNAAPSTCAVEGVPTADVCRDGPLVGPINPAGWSETGYFLADVTWSGLPWGAIGLGLSTFAPVRANDGSIGNPFLRIDRRNLSTLYLSFSVDAQALTQHLAPKQKKEGAE